MGAFSHKFSIAPSGETTDRIKKVRGSNNGTDLLYHHAEYGGDRGSRADCRGKSVMFFVSLFLSRFQITKFAITETLWSSVAFKTVMHRGRFLVVGLYSSFSMDPLDFPLGANFYKKIAFLAILGAVSPHFNATMVKVGVIVRTYRTASPMQNFVKIT